MTTKHVDLQVTSRKAQILRNILDKRVSFEQKIGPYNLHIAS